ncbi:MAG: PqqD family protein [Faecousia sp.]
MRVRDNFIFRTIAQEHLLIPKGEAALTVKGLIALSESGSLLYRKLCEDCTREDLISALTREYDVSASVAGEDVDAFLDQMRQLDMLVEDGI